MKVGQAVLGLEVPHAHIHLVPMHSEGDLNFSNKKLSLSEEEMQDIADKIFKEFSKTAKETGTSHSLFFYHHISRTIQGI